MPDGAGGGVLAWEFQPPLLTDKPGDLGRFILKSQKDHPLVYKRSRRVIGLNDASECFILSLNVRASFRGKGSKHATL